MTDPIMQLATLISAVVLLVLQQRTGKHARRAAKEAGAANDAVNNIHPKIAPNGEPHPTIYELALNNSRAIEALSKKLEAHIQPEAECVLLGCLRTELAAGEVEEDGDAKT